MKVEGIVIVNHIVERHKLLDNLKDKNMVSETEYNLVSSELKKILNFVDDLQEKEIWGTPTMEGKDACEECDECFESETKCLDSLACNLTEDPDGRYTLIRFISKCPKGKW